MRIFLIFMMTYSLTRILGVVRSIGVPREPITREQAAYMAAGYATFMLFIIVALVDWEENHA